MASFQVPLFCIGSRGVTSFSSSASLQYAWGSQFFSIPELRVQPRFMMTTRWPFQNQAIRREGMGIQVEVEQEAGEAVQRVVEESIADVVSTDGSESFHFKEQAGLTPGGSSQEVIDAAGRVFVPTYARFPVVFVKGEGCKLFDAEGREYLDMSAGIAVNALGHGDPAWVKAVTEQAATLVHVSNVYYSVPQVNLAKRLVESSFADQVFFVNSGTEANEAAIKFARKYQRVKVKERNKKYGLNIGEEQVATDLVAFTSSFHGRTMGALALTSKKQYRAPFEPIMPGVQFVQFGDKEAAQRVICPGRTAAVFVEPVQGEGGIFQAEAAFMRSLRTLCSEAGALLVFDEVQCGLGRTGQLWAHEAYELEPDIMTLAKPLAGGLPIGAVLVTEAVSSAIVPGDHGSTFAGGPLVCHAALAVLDRIQEPGFLESVTAKGLLLRMLLMEKLGRNPHVKEIRGSGLLVGVELDVLASPLVKAALNAGLLILTAGSGNIVRLVPPLIISEEEIKQAVQILTECIMVLDQTA